MKREYAAEQEHQQHHPPSNTNILHHKFHLHSPPRHLRNPECPPTSEEADSHSPNRQSPKRSNNANDDRRGFPPPPNNDGATIEVGRRPRGRPPGSKNKSKPPVVVTRELSSEPSMRPYVLELAAGVDIIESTVRFCQKRDMGLCVLNGNGVVANVTLKQPSTTQGATVTFHGHFDILSISATILPGGDGVHPPSANGPFAISLAGPQGQVVGGLVVGPLVSAGTIYLIAATFSSPSFERLQAVDHEDAAARDGVHKFPQAVSGGESGGPPIYSYQAADVIWAPTARQPQPPSAPPY